MQFFEKKNLLFILKNIERFINSEKIMESQKKLESILIITFGSRGDSQPLLALAKELQNLGKKVLFMGPESTKVMASKYQVPFSPLSGDPEAILNSPLCKEILQSKQYEKFREMKEWQESYGKIGEEVLVQAKDKDLLISVAGIAGNAWAVHKKTGIPLIIFPLHPFFPTGKFGYIAEDADPMRSDSVLNIKSWKEGFKKTLSFFSPVLTKYSKEWNVDVPQGEFGFWEELFQKKIGICCGISKKAIGGRPEDWPENVQISKFFDLQETDAKLDTEILEFLEKDKSKKPIFLSFGSMAFADPEVLKKLAIGIAKDLGKRVILSAGWVDLKSQNIENNKDILLIKGAPYFLLFPLCDLIIHHGGSGTTGAALAAGVPQVIVPFFADQPFWGEMMHKIGVASKPLSYFSIKENEILERVKFCDQEIIRERAKDIKKEMDQEKKEINIAQIIEKLLFTIDS